MQHGVGPRGQQGFRLLGGPVGEPAGRGGGAWGEGDLGGGGLGLLLRDHAGLGHGGQHFAATRGGGAGIDAGRKTAGRAGQAGDDRCLPQIHVAGGNTEIQLGRRVHAPGTGAEIDAVQPDLEDFLLGEGVFQPERQQHFLHLAAKGAGIGQEQVFRDLLGDGRAALHQAAGADVDHRRAQYADDVDAVMGVEAPVLHGHGGGRQVGWHVGQAERLTDHVAEIREDLAGPVLKRQARAACRVEGRFRAGKIPGEPEQTQPAGQRAPYAEDERPFGQAPPRASPPWRGRGGWRSGGARGNRGGDAPAFVARDLGGAIHGARYVS